MSRPVRRHPVHHQYSGFHGLKAALRNVSQDPAWLDSMGEVGESLRQWRRNLIEDLGGDDNVSSMERAIVELATRTHLMLESVDKFILAQESLVNKSRRVLYPCVMQRQQLADSLARHMTALGLKRQARPPVTLAEYVETAPAHTETAAPETPGKADGSQRDEDLRSPDAPEKPS